VAGLPIDLEAIVIENIFLKVTMLGAF